MSSRAIIIEERGGIDGAGPYAVRTGENVVIGTAPVMYDPQAPSKESAFGLANLFFSWRRACGTLSDSAIVADLIQRGLIDGPGPDDN